VRALHGNTADVQLGASPSLLHDVDIASHVPLLNGDKVLTLLPDPEDTGLSPLILASYSGVRPHIIIPIGPPATTITLTTSYQKVGDGIQSLTNLVPVITGAPDWYNLTGWHLYWVTSNSYATNPATIRSALYFYSSMGGTWHWQYHDSTYAYSNWAGGHMYHAWGPWPVTEIGSGTFQLNQKLDTGAGVCWGTNDVAANFLLFVRP